MDNNLVRKNSESGYKMRENPDSKRLKPSSKVNVFNRDGRQSMDSRSRNFKSFTLGDVD
jgi:hypothetical protein